MKRKSGFVTLLASVVPGGGQMYLGYPKRGGSMIAWFFGVMFISIVSSIGALSIFLAAIWLFAFFDAFSIRSLSDQQVAAFKDEFIPPQAWVSANIGTDKNGSGKMKKILGWALVAVGGVAVYSNLVSPALYILVGSYPIIADFVYRLPSIVIALLFVFGGVYILTRGAKDSAEGQPTGQPQATGQANTVPKEPFINMPHSAQEQQSPMNNPHNTENYNITPLIANNIVVPPAAPQAAQQVAPLQDSMPQIPVQQEIAPQADQQLLQGNSLQQNETTTYRW